MVRRVDKKTGAVWHEPPYTKAEEADFYRRICSGPLTVFHGERPAPKPEQKPQEEPEQPKD
jgi:hypothetical protein